MGSNLTRGCCVPATTQPAIPPGSVNEDHAIHWPRMRDLAAEAGIRLRVNKMEIGAALWTLEAQEGFYFYFTNTEKSDLSSTPDVSMKWS